MKTSPVPCTKEEIDAILEWASDNEFYYMLFKVAMKTGRRLGEYVGEPEMKIIGTEKYKNKYGDERTRNIKKRTGKYIGGVQVKDIDFEKKIMMTQVLKRRKKVYKEAILDDELVGLIKRYINKEKLKLDDYLFRKVGYRQIQFAIAKYAKKAGIEHPVSFHAFRHKFVTSLVKQGWSYDKIAKLTGHSSAGTLAIYDHTVASDIADDARTAIGKM
jgi:integrase